MAGKDNPLIGGAYPTYRTGSGEYVTGILQKIRANYDEVDRGSGAGLGLIHDLQTQIDAKKASLGDLQAGTESSYYTQRDPTF